MALPTTYRVGAVTVSANGTAVTGTGTNWLAGGIRAGDIFAAKGLTATIESVDSATSLTLSEPWAGPALSNAEYEIRYTPDTSRVLAASKAALVAMEETYEGSRTAIAQAQLRKNNLTAGRAPLPSDDASQGYEVGSRWLHEGREWLYSRAGGWVEVKGPSPKGYGAGGDGTTDDTLPLQQDATAPRERPTFTAAGGVNPASGTRLDYGRATIRKNTAADATMMGGAADGVWIENVTIDMARDTLGNAPGHGISINGSRNVARNVDVLNYGSDGVGGGSSVRFGAGKLNRIEGGEHVADPTAAINIGWLYSTVDYSWVRDVYVAKCHQGIAYAHELKNDSAYNHLSGLLTEDSKHALVYGQDTGLGPHHNVATGVVAGGVDRAFYTGYSHDNVVVGLLHDTNGRPGLTSIRLVTLAGSDRNAVHAAHISGPSAATERLINPAGSDNYVGASLHSEGKIYYSADSKRSVVEVYHPGPRSSILGSIEDVSDGSNVTHSPATGERIGSLSGRFHDRLGSSGFVPNDSHRWLRESNSHNLEAVLTPGVQGMLMGQTFYGSGGAQGRHWYVVGPSAAEDRYDMGVGGTHQILQLFPSRAKVNVPFHLATYTAATMPTVPSSWSGMIAYVSDGDAGSPCLAVSVSGVWRRVPLGPAVSAT